jgi:hypothetical protein
VPPHLALLLLAAALSLGACADRTTSRTPLRYPPLPNSARSDAPPATFTPDGALTPIALACRATEPSIANALDDDCDGRIDGADDGALAIALAYPRGSALRLVLQGPRGRSDVTAEPCAETQTFCTVRIRAEQLVHGRQTLLARGEASAESEAPSPLVVSVQARGKVTAYIVALTALEQERALGEIALP